MNPTDVITDFTIAMTEDKSCLREIIDEYFHPHSMLTNPLSKETERSGIYQNFAAWGNAFPNLKTLDREIQVFSNKAILKWTTRGRQVNPFFDMAATDRQIQSTGIAVWEFNEQGLIQSVNYQLDMIDFMQQLGFHMTPEMYPRQKIIKEQYTTLLKLINLNSGFISFIFRHFSRHLAPFLCSSIAFGYRIAKNGTICHLICLNLNNQNPEFRLLAAFGVEKVV